MVEEREIIGVLAFQGAFAKHREVLERLGASVIEVRRPEELEKCQALVIPGGESTVMSRQIRYMEMNESLKEFGKKRPIFGTCAGLILLAREWQLLDVQIERNGWGPQYESFSTEVLVDFGPKKFKGKKIPFHAIFIRAPRIQKVGQDVEILSSIYDEPIYVKQGHILGATFHPELAGDDAIHKYFLDLVREVKK